jgi:hypothetical protein
VRRGWATSACRPAWRCAGRGCSRSRSKRRRASRSSTARSSRRAWAALACADAERVWEAAMGAAALSTRCSWARSVRRARTCRRCVRTEARRRRRADCVVLRRSALVESHA